METTLYLLALLLTTSPLPTNQQAGPALSQPVKIQTGVASWYGTGFIGGKTANGETYRADDMTAAHRTLPFGTRVRVIDQKTGASAIVRVNNRGPFVKGRVIDLSRAAARQLGMTSRGVARVKLEILRGTPARTAKIAARNQATPIQVLNEWLKPIVSTIQSAGGAA